MGAIFQVPVARVSSLDELPGETLGLAARAGDELRGDGTEGSRTLVIGAERAGLGADVEAACDRLAHIPIGSESLNAAMAATIAVYEVTRRP
jgi:TrmH family RNA methyltransferase